MEVAAIRKLAADQVVLAHAQRPTRLEANSHFLRRDACDHVHVARLNRGLTGHQAQSAFGKIAHDTRQAATLGLPLDIDVDPGLKTYRRTSLEQSARCEIRKLR